MLHMPLVGPLLLLKYCMQQHQATKMTENDGSSIIISSFIIELLEEKKDFTNSNNRVHQNHCSIIQDKIWARANNLEKCYVSETIQSMYTIYFFNI